MKNRTYISKNLKYLRKEKKLKQEELAKIANTTQATIARWESNQVSPTIDNLIDISLYFNIDLGKLICTDLSIKDNEYDEQIKKIASDNGVEIIIDKNAPLTAQSVVDIQKILMEELDNEKNCKKK